MYFLHDAASLIEPYLLKYGPIAIFFVIDLESLGAPLPGESALVAAYLMAVEGKFSIADVFFVIWIAAVLGDSTGYAIGRVGGRPLLQRYGWVVKLTPARLARLESLFRRKGPIIVVGGGANVSNGIRTAIGSHANTMTQAVRQCEGLTQENIWVSRP